MPLTAVQLRNAKPRAKAYRLFDSNGLYVEVSPSGRLLWRMKYRFALKEKRLALGQYPRVTLADARQRAQEARRDLGDGIDPGVKKQAAKAARAIGTTDAFEAIAREWHATKRDGWSPTYAAKVLRRLELDVFPWLGGRSITTIESPDLLSVMRRIEGRGALETTKRNLEACSQVFRYAIATGRAKSDPARDLKGAIKTPITTHFAAITEPARLGELLRAVDGYQGSAIVVAALKLTPMLLLRPTELRASPWADFDLDEAVLRVAGQRMKRSRSGKLHGPPHLVPLPKQAVAILRDLYALTGHGTLAFPGQRHRDRPISENTVNAALRALGYAGDVQTAHGFRATARTMLEERLNVPPAVIEAQLAHDVPDALGRSYNRTQFLEQRRQMMQTWADYLDQLRQGAKVVPFPGAAA